MSRRSEVYKAVVVGASTGGMKALLELFNGLAETFSLPVLTVLHQHPTASAEEYLVSYLNKTCRLSVVVAEDKAPVQPGNIYMAPPNYHLLVERDQCLALSIDERVNYFRPSIDVLFESAAYVWTSGLVGILLTGANPDGAHGIEFIKKYGGHTIAQNPATAESPIMPQAAINIGAVDKIMSINEMSIYLNGLKFDRDRMQKRL